MARFIMTMPPELAERIERYRVERGLKSTAAAHVELLEAGLGDGPRITVRHTPPGPTAWPSGAMVLPEHTEDPGPTAPLRKAAEPVNLNHSSRKVQQTTGRTFGPVRPVPGALLKGKK